jgi:transposase-like protein
MRYSASEKAEIIQLVEQSHLPAKRTLDKLGIPRATFYRWYDRYRTGGPEALSDHRSQPDRVWNRIPDNVRRQIIDLALEVPELSPRELAVRFTDEKQYFVSESSVYRLLKAHDLVTSPAYVVIKAADEATPTLRGCPRNDGETCSRFHHLANDVEATRPHANLHRPAQMLCLTIHKVLQRAGIVQPDVLMGQRVGKGDPALSGQRMPFRRDEDQHILCERKRLKLHFRVNRACDDADVGASRCDATHDIRTLRLF